MSSSGSESSSDREVVSVSQHGQATIPKRFRERLGIDAPGKVSFRETEEGEVVVERIPSAEEMRGFAARVGSESGEDASATELLRQKRERDVQAREAQFEGTDE